MQRIFFNVMNTVDKPKTHLSSSLTRPLRHMHFCKVPHRPQFPSRHLGSRLKLVPKSYEGHIVKSQDSEEDPVSLSPVIVSLLKTLAENMYPITESYTHSSEKEKKSNDECLKDGYIKNLVEIKYSGKADGFEVTLKVEPKYTGPATTASSSVNGNGFSPAFFKGLGELSAKIIFEKPLEVCAFLALLFLYLQKFLGNLPEIVGFMNQKPVSYILAVIFGAMVSAIIAIPIVVNSVQVLREALAIVDRS